MNHKNNISANSIDPAFDFIEDSLEFTDWTFAVNFKGVNVVEYDSINIQGRNGRNSSCLGHPPFSSLS